MLSSQSHIPEGQCLGRHSAWLVAVQTLGQTAAMVLPALGQAGVPSRFQALSPKMCVLGNFHLGTK